MIASALLLASLMAKGLVTEHPNCYMTPLNKEYSVCILNAPTTDGVTVSGSDSSLGIVLFVNKKGEMMYAEPGRYTVDPAVADPKKYPPIVVYSGSDYRQFIGANQLKDGTKIEFYYYDGPGQQCDVYSISADGKKYTELKDGGYTLKSGQAFTVENGVVQEGVYDADKGKIVDPLVEQTPGPAPLP